MSYNGAQGHFHIITMASQTVPNCVLTTIIARLHYLQLTYQFLANVSSCSFFTLWHVSSWWGKRNKYGLFIYRIKPSWCSRNIATKERPRAGCSHQLEYYSNSKIHEAQWSEVPKYEIYNMRLKAAKGNSSTGGGGGEWCVAPKSPFKVFWLAGPKFLEMFPTRILFHT